MSERIQRYDYDAKYGQDYPLVEHSTGYWCRYRDAEQRIATLEAELAQAREAGGRFKKFATGCIQNIDWVLTHSSEPYDAKQVEVRQEFLKQCLEAFDKELL